MGLIVEYLNLDGIHKKNYLLSFSIHQPRNVIFVNPKKKNEYNTSFFHFFSLKINIPNIIKKEKFNIPNKHLVMGN